MSKVILLTTIVFSVMFLSPNVVMGETMDDLVERNGLFYKKFSDTPFTGKITGKYQGSFKNGKKDGAWVSYNQDGTVNKKLTGTFKNGNMISD